MTKTPISKSQTRLMEAANMPLVDGYFAAKDLLEAAGFFGDGIPAGHTWRTAAKLDAAELLKLAKRTERSEGNDLDFC